MEDKISQKREHTETETSITEESKADKLEEKKPNTILWGSKPLSSGLLSPNGSQDSLTPKSEENTNLLKWGTGKNSLSTPSKISPISVSTSTTDKEKSDEKKEDVVFQMRVTVYILEDKEYKNRGRGLLKVLKLDENNTTKYQCVMHREGELGGIGTVLVINSLLYKETPVKEMNGYVVITFPESETKFTTYLLKPAGGKKVEELKEGLEKIIQSIA